MNLSSFGHEMTLATNSKVLSLYKTMLRASEKFVDKNYRSYAIRRVRDGFKQGAKEKEPARINGCIIYAKDNLEIIKRQSTVGQLFGL